MVENIPVKSARSCCRKCLYPLATCVCSDVAVVPCNSVIDIVQHFSEVKAAKNTARLIPLCIPSAKIWVGDTAEDFVTLETSLKNETRKILVLYPGFNSKNINTLKEIHTDKTLPIANHESVSAYRLILIDGTWKKSYRLWMNNPWLRDYQAVHIDDCLSSYHIRKAPQSTYLSTIEALSFSLKVLEPELDVESLNDVFQKMQSFFYKRGNSS